ncbi:HEAT repeat domain-containing protein [Salinirubellus sp. GCM10025818]|jgi:HEAT repeat protein|uniref:HEAT repeat domain-containing protein n=1 Tax=Salinirubellus TaxID=2162630 RepID=UPI0030CA7963
MVRITEDLRLALEADDPEELEEIIERGDPEDFGTFQELIENEETSTTYRRRALYALGKWPDRETDAVNTIESVLPRLTELERITAVSTLRRIGTSDARELIVSKADDDSPDVRRQVVKGLSRIGDETAMDMLRELAKDDETEHVRELAQEKLRRLQGE